MSLPDFLKTPIKQKRAYEKTQKKVIRKYDKVCPAFVEEFKRDLDAGWSISYACRTIPHELHAVKRAFNEYPELKELYDAYLLRKTTKAFHIKK